MAVVDVVMKRRKVEIEARIAEIDDLYRDALKAVPADNATAREALSDLHAAAVAR